MANGDVTTNELMEFLEKNMVMREEFDGFRGEFDGFRGEFDDFKKETVRRTDLLESKVDKLSGRVDHIENQMVTKDYLDSKLADLGAEIGKRINKQAKLEEDFRKTLIDILASKSILQGADIERLKEFI